MSLIFKRKSVRKFTEEKVSDDKINNLLKAGMQAPSSCNSQPWEFIVVSKEDDKQAISQMHQTNLTIPNYLVFFLIVLIALLSCLPSHIHMRKLL